jgi:hypothetical protein
MPDDGPYSSYSHGETRFVFEERAQNFIQDLAAYNHAIREIYNASFGWKLDEREDLALTSTHQQVANAYATFFPNVKTVWFPSGAGMLEEMAESSWLLALATHETSHLYQLNAKGKFNSALKHVFFNVPWTFFFGIPIFIHPNVFTPTFLLEGNAVFNESRFNLGGRLHSGEKRALVFSQILAGDIDPSRLINSELKFPYGEEAYLQGGYFMAHLARKYGVDKTNQFFVEQGDHWLNPLILNNTFRKHFGASYPQEIREYVRELENQARPMRVTPGYALATGIGASNLNGDRDTIWLMMTNGVERPQLITFDRSAKVITKQSIDLPLGKVFYNSSREPEAVASIPHDLHHVEYSLYGEGLKFNENYRGQIVTDQRAGKTVALDATNSWLEPQLLVNGVFYDLSHSTAILDEKGSVYYFRQNGVERILIKDREPLAKYKGFYGKPCDVGSRGEVYFIANTEYGSSLYKFEKHEITRVLASDTIVDAMMINDKEALVVEVQSKGYELKVAALESPAKVQAPAVYDYGFPTQSLTPEKVTSAPEVQAQKSSYNSLTHTRISAVDLELGASSSNGVMGHTSVSFVDPLEWSAFNLRISRTSDPRTYFGFSYDYSRYLIEILLSYDYSFRRNYDSAGNRNGQAFTHEAALGLGVPLLQWRRWSSQLQEYALYEKDDAILSREEKSGVFSKWFLAYSERTRVGMFPWREFILSYQNKLEAPSTSWTKNQNTSMADVKYTHGLPQEIFIRGNMTAGWAETRDITVQYSNVPSLTKATIDRIAGKEIFDTKRAYRARLEVAKVFNMSAYSPRVPVSVRRLAPFIVGQSIALADARDEDSKRPEKPTLYEFGYGVDLELLLLHRIPVLIRMLNGQDNLKKENDFSATLSLSHQF